MKVIGAGLPRTATTTQLFALEELGFGPCYHMRDLLADLEAGLPLWEAAAEGRPDWDAIFGAAQSTVDWPSARWYSPPASLGKTAMAASACRPLIMFGCRSRSWSRGWRGWRSRAESAK